VDYSLQLQEGLQAVFGSRNGNPCFDYAKAHHDAAGDAEASRAMAPMSQAQLAAGVPPGEHALRSRPREIVRVPVMKSEPVQDPASASELHRR